MARQTMDAPFEIETLLPDGVRYVLPVRQWGKFQMVSLVLKLLGVAFFIGGGYSVASTIAEAFAPPNGFDWFALFSLPFTLPLFLIGLLLYVIGTFIRSGQNTITLQNGVLTTREQAGPFHWSWQRSVEEITGLSVHKAQVKVNGQAQESGPLAQLSFVKVDSSGVSPFILAVCYPSATTQALARDLGERLETHVEVHEEPWDFSTEAPPALLPKEPLSQPKGSDISIERFEDGVTLKIPPAGWRGAKGLLGFSLCWCGFMVIFTTLFVVAGFKDAGLDELGTLLIFVAFTGVFWLIGIGMMLGAISMARRRAAIAVVDDSLMVLEIGLFRTKRREWNRNELESIQLGSSGTSVNNVPVMELQIRGPDVEKTGLLSSRNNEELRWIADLLTRALKLGPGADREPHEDFSS